MLALEVKISRSVAALYVNDFFFNFFFFVLPFSTSVTRKVIFDQFRFGFHHLKGWNEARAAIIGEINREVCFFPYYF